MEGSRRQVGYGSGISPEAPPLRAATRRRPPQRPYGTPRSNVGHKLSVRKRTCFAHAWCARSPAYSLAKSRRHASSQTPHTRRYSPAVPPSCTPSQRCRPTRQLRAALSPSNFLQSHLKFPSQLTQVPTAVMHPAIPARHGAAAFRGSEEVTTSCAPNPVRNKEARPRT